eukprot:423544-Rhodomonas_salina.2
MGPSLRRHVQDSILLRLLYCNLQSRCLFACERFIQVLISIPLIRPRTSHPIPVLPVGVPVHLHGGAHK